MTRFEDIETYEAIFRAHLGDVLRENRTARRWTQRQFADAAGVHVNVIGSVERGRSAMRVSTLVALSDALEATSSDLVSEAERRARAEMTSRIA